MDKKYHVIYKITNTITGKFYIGMHSTNDLTDGYMGSGIRIKNSIRKYGVENHKFEIIKECANREELALSESRIITNDLLNNPLCLNLKSGGEKVNLVGGNLSRETKTKMSEASKQKWADPEYKAKMKKIHSEREHSYHHIEAMTLAKLGVPRSIETKRKVSIAGKGKKLNCGQKAIVIDGVEYTDCYTAANCLGIPRTTIQSRIKNLKFINYYYKDQPKELE